MKITLAKKSRCMGPIKDKRVFFALTMGSMYLALACVGSSDLNISFLCIFLSWDDLRITLYWWNLRFAFAWLRSRMLSVLTAFKILRCPSTPLPLD
jgi:hypothetical protein